MSIFGLIEQPLITNTSSSNIELGDLDEIMACDLALWEDFNFPPDPSEVSTVTPNQQMVVHNEPRPTNTLLITQAPNIVTTTMYNTNVEMMNSNRRNGRYKSSSLELEEIQKYFDVPITRAAKELNVGLTVLKKRCRELNIMRWPHRKLKSLKSLIHNVKVILIVFSFFLFLCFPAVTYNEKLSVIMQELGLSNEVAMLEEHKRWVERVPETELTERTKKLRQACFKANYKKRRSMQQAAFA